MFTARYLYRSPVISNIYEQPPSPDRNQQLSGQQKQNNGGYPMYDNNGYTPSTLSKNTNEYVPIVDTKNQVCIENNFLTFAKETKKSKEQHVLAHGKMESQGIQKKL